MLENSEVEFDPFGPRSSRPFLCPSKKLMFIFTNELVKAPSHILMEVKYVM